MLAGAASSLLTGSYLRHADKILVLAEGDGSVSADMAIEKGDELLLLMQLRKLSRGCGCRC